MKLTLHKDSFLWLLFFQCRIQFKFILIRIEELVKICVS